MVSGCPVFSFFYSEQDFFSKAKIFCTSYKHKGVSLGEYDSDIITALTAKSKQYHTEGPSLYEMIHLDNNLVQWVRETYRPYGVNIFSFASDLADTYYQRYVKYERGDFGERSYYVNNYNHRYNDNPFDIDRI